MIPRPMEDSQSFALARTCRLLRRRVHALMEEVGLHRGQQFVLGALWEREGYTQSELAQQTRVSSATITCMLQRMERNGLVERRQDTRDLRVSRVYLTDAGRLVQQAAEAAWRQIEGEALAGFASDESALLGDLLRRVRQNLTPAAAEDGGPA
jgi:DNA-binding MarR family transcriptional regulator